MKKELQKLSGLSESQFDTLNNLYPVKVSPYLFSQIKRSEAIAKQFLPSIEELQKTLLSEEPFKGLLKSKIRGFERLYEDRVVLKLTSVCPSNCRICYRRKYVFAKEEIITDEEIKEFIKFIKKDKKVRNVLLTGGSPLLLAHAKLEKVIKEVSKVPHIDQIYFAIGRPIMGPHLITEKFAKMLAKYQKQDYKNSEKSLSVGVTVHINHPDELTSEVLRSLNRLTSKGITVWTQTILLKGINDNEKTITELLKLFRVNNLIPYYLIHAMPLIGTDHFRTTVAKGLEIMKYIEKFSGHERPIYVIVPVGGKVQLSSNIKLKYKQINGKRYVVLNMPYKAKEFLSINNLKELPENHFIGEGGFINVNYLDGEE